TVPRPPWFPLLHCETSTSSLVWPLSTVTSSSVGAQSSEGSPALSGLAHTRYSPTASTNSPDAKKCVSSLVWRETSSLNTLGPSQSSGDKTTSSRSESTSF